MTLALALGFTFLYNFELAPYEIDNGGSLDIYTSVVPRGCVRWPCSVDRCGVWGAEGLL